MQSFNKRGLLILSLLFVLPTFLYAQKNINIKSFGAKGDGRTNDHDAFVKASEFINKTRRNVKLTIPAGTYIIGKQNMRKSADIYYEGVDLIHLSDCDNIQIVGSGKVKLKYASNLKFGSFDPNTNKKYLGKSPFYNRSYICQLGCAIYMGNCSKITITGVEIDGNSTQLDIGGPWGDTGYQLWHYGLYLSNCKNVKINQTLCHHFALDGISISGNGEIDNNISLNGCKFDYNGRQGLSWIGGKNLTIDNCSFNHTGKANITSSPGAGIDFEAEGGHVITKASIKNSEFINNSGCGITADSGPSSDIHFNNCTFWGVTAWSAWVQKPNFTFTGCRFYGSFVHGYITTKMEEATKFYSCFFEDKPYQGAEVYGGFLLESDGRKLMVFDKCTFTANKKKVMWFNGVTLNENEKAIFSNSTINVKNHNLAYGDWYAVMRKMRITNTTFNHFFPKQKKNYLNEDNNVKQNIQTKDLSK